MAAQRIPLLVKADCLSIGDLLRDCPDRTDQADCSHIIDMHGHWADFPGAYLPAADEAKMLAAMDRCGVRTIVCSSHEALLGDFERGNRAMQAAIERHPGRILGYWAVNPHHPASWRQAPADLAMAKGFIGFTKRLIIVTIRQESMSGIPA